MEKNNAAQLPKKEFFLKNLKWYEHLAAGWPLILVFAGGAIGVACGGLAYALNGKIFNSKVSTVWKYISSFLIGIGAILLYLLVIVVLAVIFPGLFEK